MLPRAAILPVFANICAIGSPSTVVDTTPEPPDPTTETSDTSDTTDTTDTTDSATTTTPPCAIVEGEWRLSVYDIVAPDCPFPNPDWENRIEVVQDDDCGVEVHGIKRSEEVASGNVYTERLFIGPQVYKDGTGNTELTLDFDLVDDEVWLGNETWTWTTLDGSKSCDGVSSARLTRP